MKDLEQKTPFSKQVNRETTTAAFGFAGAALGSSIGIPQLGSLTSTLANPAIDFNKKHIQGNKLKEFGFMAATGGLGTLTNISASEEVRQEQLAERKAREAENKFANKNYYGIGNLKAIY